MTCVAIERQIHKVFGFEQLILLIIDPDNKSWILLRLYIIILKLSSYVAKFVDQKWMKFILLLRVDPVSHSLHHPFRVRSHNLTVSIDAPKSNNIYSLIHRWVEGFWVSVRHPLIFWFVFANHVGTFVWFWPSRKSIGENSSLIISDVYLLCNFPIIN